MDSRTTRSVDRTVQKMLRRMDLASTVAASNGASASTAAHALKHMSEIQKRLTRGDIDGAQKLAEKVAVRDDTVGSKQGTIRRPLRDSSTPRRPLSFVAMIAAGGIAATLLVGSVFAQTFARRSHSVSGIITLDRQPLPNVELTFQRWPEDREPVRVMTSEKGRYAIEALSAGEYVIFVSPGDSGVTVPKKYLSPRTTPFRLKLARDLSDLQMLAVSGKPKRGP